jgi:hypothetical protein
MESQLASPTWTVVAPERWGPSSLAWQKFAARSGTAELLDLKPIGALWPGLPRFELAANLPKVDFVLAFSGSSPGQQLLRSAAHGVWRFKPSRYDTPAPGFWEIHDGCDITEARLVRTLLRDGKNIEDEVLKTCRVPTHKLSWTANLQRILSHAADMARWACLDLRAFGKVQVQTDGASPGETRGWPNAFHLARYYVCLAKHWIDYKLENQRIEQWNVGLINAHPQAFLNRDFRPVVEWSRYSMAGQMVADPFPVIGDAKLRLLVEEWDWYGERSRLAEMQRGTDGRLSALRPIVDEGVNISYPFTFEYEDTMYCLPECHDKRELVLYRWDADTGSWLRGETLIRNVDAVDATIFPAHDSWWILHGGTDLTRPWSLYVWNAPELLGPWKPHPGNPVKTDVTSSRPAGHPFWHQGALYRPAQNNRKYYGGGITINRIDHLSMDNFRETPVRLLEPDTMWPFRDGIHTFTHCADTTVIDAKRHRWPMSIILSRWWAKVRHKPRRRPFQLPPGCSELKFSN